MLHLPDGMFGGLRSVKVSLDCLEITSTACEIMDARIEFVRARSGELATDHRAVVECGVGGTTRRWESRERRGVSPER